MAAAKPVSRIWWVWLLAVGIYLTLDALVGVALLPEVWTSLAYDVIYGPDAHLARAVQEASFQNLLGIMAGAFQGSAGVMIAFLAYHPFRRGERWAWAAISCATFPWFVLSSLAGIFFLHSGRREVVILGPAFYLILLAPPLVFSWRAFFRSQRS